MISSILNKVGTISKSNFTIVMPFVSDATMMTIYSFLFECSSGFIDRVVMSSLSNLVAMDTSGVVGFGVCLEGN